jgi:hypothetical protein
MTLSNFVNKEHRGQHYLQMLSSTNPLLPLPPALRETDENKLSNQASPLLGSPSMPQQLVKEIAQLLREPLPCLLPRPSRNNGSILHRLYMRHRSNRLWLINSD